VFSVFSVSVAMPPKVKPPKKVIDLKKIVDVIKTLIEKLGDQIVKVSKHVCNENKSSSDPRDPPNLV
jgi:hypothetical protein